MSNIHKIAGDDQLELREYDFLIFLIFETKIPQILEAEFEEKADLFEYITPKLKEVFIRLSDYLSQYIMDHEAFSQKEK